MIVGDPTIFAIESGVTSAYERHGFRALGFFMIHIGGIRYGVHEPDATMLACSLGEIEERIARKGMHAAPFATEQSLAIADAFRWGIYPFNDDKKRLFGMSQSELSEIIHSKHLMWAPDGDEAFDDGSYVLQFDVGDSVRLIGFRCSNGGQCDPFTLADVSIDAVLFYSTLEKWRAAFLAQWQAAPKISSELA